MKELYFLNVVSLTAELPPFLDYLSPRTLAIYSEHFMIAIKGDRVDEDYGHLYHS